MVDLEHAWRMGRARHLDAMDGEAIVGVYCFGEG